MGRIYCIMGKSSSGKDTIYKKLVEDPKLSLKRIVPYTTRPMRVGERDGIEYYFCSEETLQELSAAGKVIELRAYDTVHGVWKYFTADDHQIADGTKDYLTIGTLEAYEKLRRYFGSSRVVPIYIEVEDGLRLQRALDRERSQAKPGYEEMCRRFLADASDFSEAKLAQAGIVRRFYNQELQKTIEEIKDFMRS